MSIFVGLLLLLFTAIPSFANDGNAAITPKGIVFKEEKGILLDTEKLLITPSEIEVEYKFNNTTPNDIETDVAFPIPMYGSESLRSTGGIPDFSDFTVEIDNSVVEPKTVIKALVNGKDYADMLRAKGVSITNFENITDGALDEDLDAFRKKIGKDLQLFQKLGIVDKEGVPQWTVSLTYFWHMKFVAGKSTVVKHTYTPYSGNSYTNAGFFDLFTEGACLDAKSKDKINRMFKKKDQVFKRWIPYILTTANTWQKPIREFQLIVKKKPQQVVSLCSDSTFSKEAPTEMRVIRKDYIPTKDLTVYFFGEGPNFD